MVTLSNPRVILFGSFLGLLDVTPSSKFVIPDELSSKPVMLRGFSFCGETWFIVELVVHMNSVNHYRDKFGNAEDENGGRCHHAMRCSLGWRADTANALMLSLASRMRGAKRMFRVDGPVPPC
ncbi:hypothetical protein BRAS3843_1690016 [Bradyrhizobium sp. STM 3843]|nr:hypothetical protein BRAS3843_1690016 [Bradyrhizobium sp. STM 3843]